MTTAREVVEHCARVAHKKREYYHFSSDRFGSLVLDYSDGTSREVFAGTRDACELWVELQCALAVIRALASVGCTRSMYEAMCKDAFATAAEDYQAALTALADGYERERVGGG